MKKQIKVAYFPSDTPKNKVLGSNGKSLDKYCIKCIPDEDLSTGNYIVDLTFLIDDNIQDLLQEEAILKVLLDYGNEEFRISKVTVGTRYIEVVARQITIADSLTLWLEDVRPTNLNGQSAVSWMLDKAEGNKEIQIVSDIDSINTAYYQRMSLYKALHDNDNSFLKRWGGEVQRRGYTIYINKRIGIDRGFSIREGKNITGFECSSNIDNLVTRARGQGFNGILGNYIDSPLIGSYNRIYTSVIKYEDVKLKDENNEEGYDTLEQAQAELDRRINEEFSKNDIDKIKASYTINFVQLEKTEEYKNYIAAERLFIGDNSRVYIPKLNVDIKVRAISKKYDVLAQKTKEIKLSNYIEVKALSIKEIINRLENIDSTDTVLQMAKDNATALIKAGLKNSNAIVRENEFLVMDTKDINTATNVWRWNSGGLGHSKTGYYGEFGTAITQDGAIVADFITVGILNANLIKTGILKSFDSTTWINMENGTFNFANKIKFDGNNFSIDLSGKDLATNKDVEAALILNNTNLVAKFSNSGATNLIRNGNVTKDRLNYWWTENDASIWNVKTNDYIGIYKHDSSEGFLVSETIKVEPGKTYSFSCKVIAEGATLGADVFFIGSSNSDRFYGWTPQLGAVDKGNSETIKYTFTVPSNINYGFIRLDTNGSTDYSGGFVCWFKDMVLIEGEIPSDTFIPHPSEIYDGSTMIDANGVTIKNGALRVLNNEEKEVLKGDSDGNLTISGKITNVKDGFGIEIDKGGMLFNTSKEVVGGIRSAIFPSNNAINGIVIANTRDGDFIDFGFTNSENFDSSGVSFTTKMRISRNVLSQTGNFIGIQFKDDIRVDKGRRFYLESNDENAPHLLQNSIEGLLNIFGDNGLNLGYREGKTNRTSIQITESQISNGSRIIFFDQLSMNGNNIRMVPDIFTERGTKYFHDGWCGSIESTAKRISNLNTFFDSGWYGFGEGANGAPVTWGVLLHIKLSSNDFSQLVIGTDNKMYTRWWVNNGWTGWVQR